MSVINRMLRDLDARGARPATGRSPGTAHAADVQAPLHPVARLPDDHAWSAWRRTTLWSAIGALAVGTWLLGPPWVESATRPVTGPAAAAALSAPADTARPQAAAPQPVQAATVAQASIAAAPAASAMDWGMRHLPSHRSAVAPAAPVQAAQAARLPARQSVYVAAGLPPLPGQPAAQAADPRATADKLFAAAGNKDLFTLVSPPAAGHPPTTVAAAVRPAAPAPAQRAAAALEQAQTLVDEGRAADALEAARSAVRQDPANLEARKLAIRLALEVGEAQAATTLIDEGLARKPADAELALLRARQLMAQGRNDEALAALQAMGPLHAEANGLRAGLLANGGDYAQAARAYEQALRLRPTNATWWLGLGVALDNQGQPRQARQAYARARALGTLRADLSAWLDQKLQ